ncbi:hypothetical protein [Pseudoxanthomonas mexicana]|uniref:hypothetical protein n=1 Tax=Pseudoxanthomonas mexicana TaxID=128785 RepID=UPI001FD718B1|nr:hypothetical protein [Pseudoxanthomonas mexicana]UOV03494.1 hypothetical protein MUU73_17005 [Pseudoxanthomonas mexicana]
MTCFNRSSVIGSSNISTPVIIIGLVGRHIRNQAVSTRDIGSRRGFACAFFVAMLALLSRAE